MTAAPLRTTLHLESQSQGIIAIRAYRCWQPLLGHVPFQAQKPNPDGLRRTPQTFMSSVNTNTSSDSHTYMVFGMLLVMWGLPRRRRTARCRFRRRALAALFSVRRTVFSVSNMRDNSTWASRADTTDCFQCVKWPWKFWPFH
eukprot:10763665-Alexandrium_andersonii.AAC.1